MVGKAKQQRRRDRSKRDAATFFVPAGPQPLNCLQGQVDGAPGTNGTISDPGIIAGKRIFMAVVTSPTEGSSPVCIWQVGPTRDGEFDWQKTGTDGTVTINWLQSN